MNQIDSMLKVINKYGSLDNEEQLSNEEKDRIMKITMENISEESRKRVGKFGNKKVCAGIIGAILAFSTVGVSAGVIFNWNQKLVKYLNLDNSQRDELVTTGMEINQSVTDNGLTLTAVQAVGDKHSVYILFDVDAPEGIDLNKNSDFWRMKWKIDGVVSSSAQSSMIQYDKNKGALLLQFQISEDINGRNIDIEFDNFGYRDEIKDYDNLDEDYDGFNKQLEGQWKLSWNLNYKDISKDYEVGKEMSIYGGVAVFESINLSPYSVTIILSEKEPFAVHWHEDIWGDDRALRVKLKNGDIIDKNNCGGIGSDFTVITMSFGKAINIDDIESVSFNRVEVKL